MSDLVDDAHSLLGPYVIGAVDEADRATFEQHLRTCADCRAEVAELADVVDTLVDAEAVAPPASLRAHVMESIAVTPQLPPSAAPRARAVVAVRRYRWPLAGAAAALAVAVGGVSMVLGTGRGTNEASALERDVMMVSSAPDAHSMDLALGSSHLVMSEHMQGVAVMGQGAPAPSKGMEYQLWLILDDGRQLPGPTFMPDADGEFMAMMHADFADVTQFAVTEEPHGGSPSPTGKPVALISL